MITKTMTVISCSDWDKFIVQTYNRPYCFQQQNGCRDRGKFQFSVPVEDYNLPDDFSHLSQSLATDTVIIPAIRSSVPLEVWLERDPSLKIKPRSGELETDAFLSFITTLFWHREFYPSIYLLANDLYEKGLLPAGDYLIDIDW